jgi:hypothetical protein
VKTIAAHGAVLGAACVAWTFVMGFTGWYKHPALLNLFWLVVVFECVVLYVGLRKTAGEGRTYGRQLLAGTAIAGIAAPIVFAGSLLFTTVAFPRYFEDLREMHERILVQRGLSGEKVAEALKAAAASQTSMASALSGAIGTVVTGVVVSALLAIWLRAKPVG